MSETRSEWYFIVNPRAGSGKTMSKWVPAENELAKRGIPYVTEMTDYKRHATFLAYQAAVQGYRHIVAVGGDGSLHETLSGIVSFCNETGTPTEEFYLGVAPIGSGNDWIKSLNVPNDVGKVIDLIAENSFASMDVVEVLTDGNKVSFMANVGGVGFDSHVCKRVNIQKEGGMRGKRIYLNSLRYAITHIKPINIRVVADGEEVHSGPCYSVALGNGKYSGSGMRQVPLAVMDDGILDGMVVPVLSLVTMLKEIPRLFSGTVNESTNVRSFRCRSLQIIPLDEESKDIIELDGEIEGRLPLSIEMGGRKINVIKG